MLKLKSFGRRKKVLLPVRSRITLSKEKLVCASKFGNFDQYYQSQNLTLAFFLPLSCLPKVHLHGQSKIVEEQEEGVTDSMKEENILEGESGMCTKIQVF